MRSRENGDLTSLLGDKGHMAFTVDQGAEMERYQGIVPLEGDNLADAALGYFDRSEQIGTAIKLAAAPCFCPAAKPNGVPAELWCNKWRPMAALSILKRRLRVTLTILMMIGTDWKFFGDHAEPSELLDADVSGEQLAFRLFHEDGVRVFEPRGLQFACPCTRERVLNMLAGLSDQDQAEMCNHKKTSKCAANFVMKIMFLNLSRRFRPALDNAVTIGIETVGGDWFHTVKALYF